MAVLSLEKIVESEVIDIQQYGLKTQGLADLYRLRDELHLDFSIPDGFVVPVSGALPIQIKKALYDLTANDTERVMLLARSSSPNEEPGKFTTVPVFFDPNDRQNSFTRFMEAYKTVVGKEPKAVIGQKIVGNVSEYDGKQVFGLNNTSFILQIPSFNPDQMAISCARGLADRVVGEDGSKVVFIDYDYVRKKVVRALDKPDRFYKELYGCGHRQTDAECFDLATGNIISLRIGGEFDEPMDFGRVRSGSGERFMVPFRDNSEIDNLAKIVIALKDRRGKPLEVEGAYVNGKLHLFQLRELETLPSHDIQLSEGKYFVGGTDMVIGSGRYTLDLVWFKDSIKRNVSAGSVAGYIAGLMRDYRERPYFAYIDDYFQGGLINQLGENCRIVGTGFFENIQSHTVGVVRKRMAQGKMDLYLNQCGLEMGYFHKRGERAPDKEYAGGAIQVWKDITVESDGRVAQIFFEDDNPEEAGKYKLDDLEVISLEQARQSPENLAGKVISHPQYDLALHISESGRGVTNIAYGRYCGNGGSSRAYTLEDIEEHFRELIDFYKLEKKPQIQKSNS